MGAQSVSSWSFPLIPFESYAWEISGSASDIVQRLAAITTPAGLFDPFPEETLCDFRGGVSETRLHLRPVLGYRNSFYPVVVGWFTPTPRGVRLTVHLRLAWPTVVLLLLWGSIVARFFVALAEQSNADTGAPLQMLIPLAMLLFGAAITIAGFKYEARKVRGTLRKAIAGPAD